MLSDRLPVTPMATEPGSMSRKSKGAWREQRPKIKPGDCQDCVLCSFYCPEGAIRVKGGELTINLHLCKGCGICANECQDRIEMVPEFEGKRGILA